MNCLLKALLPSSRAAPAEGPKTARPRAWILSVSPWQSGISGPTTVRSIPWRATKSATASRSDEASGGQSAISAMPALPGLQNSSSTTRLWRIFHASACSRPPPPMTSTFMCDSLSSSDRERPEGAPPKRGRLPWFAQPALGGRPERGAILKQPQIKGKKNDRVSCACKSLPGLARNVGAGLRAGPGNGSRPAGRHGGRPLRACASTVRAATARRAGTPPRPPGGSG